MSIRLDIFEVIMQRKSELYRMALAAGRGLAFSIVVVSLMGIQPGKAQSPSQSDGKKTDAATPQSFEVASIKPSAPQPTMFFRTGTGMMPGGRYTASGITVKMLIQMAYDLRDYQISGGPSWISTDRFDIVAKAETPNVSREQGRILLQSLLAERFNLKIRRETNELAIYALVVGKDGPKLHKSEVKPGSGTSAQQPGPAKPGDAGPAPVVKMGGAGGSLPAVTAGGGPTGGGAAGTVAVMTTAGGGNGMMRMGPGQLNAQGASISTLVLFLSQTLGRPVIDKTGLEGNYDFNLQVTPDESQRGLGIGGGDRPDMMPPGDFSGPSIFTAVQEQLGLKLESQKGPVPMLVIEHVEKPSPD